MTPTPDHNAAMDGLAQLAHALFGRDALPSEWLGGSEAKILYAAASAIRHRSARVETLEKALDTLIEAATGAAEAIEETYGMGGTKAFRNCIESGRLALSGEGEGTETMSELTHAGGKGESFCDVREVSPSPSQSEQVRELRAFADWLQLSPLTQKQVDQIRPVMLNAAATIERLEREQAELQDILRMEGFDGLSLVGAAKNYAEAVKAFQKRNVTLASALTLATRERDEAMANKNAEIEILVDLLKRGFAISNREGWEEGENETEWQSIASDVIATYDRKYRQHGLRSIEDRIALEKQQAAEIDRLTQQRDEAVKVIERLPKTADGVVVYYEEQELFHPNETAPHHHNEFHPAGTCSAYFGDHSDRCSERLSSDCFSTREAALAKQEATPR